MSKREEWLTAIIGVFIAILLAGVVAGFVDAKEVTGSLTVSAIVKGLEVKETRPTYHSVLQAFDTIVTSPKTMLQAPLLDQRELYYPNVQLEVQ